MSRQILLTISILISNRPDTVRKCLDSVKPLLENVPSELILVDTGCGGQVRKIIEEYTDKIIDFEWCRDFSKARNAGLERAKGKWFLYLDDDEWFEDVTEIIRFFNSGEYAAYGVGLYSQRNYLLLDGSEYTELLVGRMIRLEPDIRFIYRIHECFSRAPGYAKKLRVYVHHYGYIYKTPEEAKEHARRNISLLLEERREQPSNMRHAVQLAQEYNAIKQREDSLAVSLECIEKAEQGPVEEVHCLSSLYVNEINCYIELERYGEAVCRGELHLKNKRTDALSKALIAGRITTAYMEQKDYEKCLEHTEYYWNVYQDYVRHDEKYMAFESPITDTCFHERRRTQILGNGVRAAVRFGKAAQAWKWFQDIGWQGNKGYVDEELIRDILGRMPEAADEEKPFYEKMCNIFLEHEELRAFAIGTMMEVCGRYGEIRDRIRAGAAYRNLQSDHWFLQILRLSAAAFRPEAGGIYNPADAERIAGEIWSVMEESMPQMERFDTPGAVERLGGDNRCVLESVPFRRWELGIAWYFGHYAWKDCGWWTECFDRILEPESMHLLVWQGACGISRASSGAAVLDRQEMAEDTAALNREVKAEDAAVSDWEEKAEGAAALDREEKAVGEAVDGETCGTGERQLERKGALQEREPQQISADAMEAIFTGLNEYALCRTALCQRIYREEIIQDMPEILPEEYRGAYAIWSLLEMAEAGQYAEAVAAVREIRELLPGLSNIMKHCLKWLDGQMKRQKAASDQAAGEFRILAGQIKAKVYELMEAGAWQAALGVVEQLRTLLPEDEEIQALREKISQKS